MALGIDEAGFDNVGFVEIDKHACAQLEANQRLFRSRNFSIHNEDVRNIDLSRFSGLKVDLLTGGPPCQPFSAAGNRYGSDDPRDMFPQTVRAVKALMPRAFLFENVRGLLSISFRDYLEYVELKLRFPFEEIGKRTVESHIHQLRRIYKVAQKDESYLLYRFIANASEFGVPQRRLRVFFVGISAREGKEWSPPEPTHSPKLLAASKWLGGEYWSDHQIAKKDRQLPPARINLRRLAQLASDDQAKNLKRARTMRDVFHDLPEPSKTINGGLNNHVLIEGAKAYPGHTGSLLDEPAKTIKAGVHGVPGGENMFHTQNNVLRYFTTREMARLQTFPDEYVFSGTWNQSVRQLGNAVPVELAHVLGQTLSKCLER